MKNVKFNNLERPFAVSPFRRPKRSAAIHQIGCHVNKRAPSEHLCQKFAHNDLKLRNDEKGPTATKPANMQNIEDDDVSEGNSQR